MFIGKIEKDFSAPHPTFQLLNLVAIQYAVDQEFTYHSRASVRTPVFASCCARRKIWTSAPHLSNTFCQIPSVFIRVAANLIMVSIRRAVTQSPIARVYGSSGQYTYNLLTFSTSLQIDLIVVGRKLKIKFLIRIHSS